MVQGHAGPRPRPRSRRSSTSASPSSTPHLKGNAYLLGKDFSAADAYAFTIVNWVNFLGMNLNSFPNLKAYMDRVAARPKVQAALKAEGLVAA